MRGVTPEFLAEMRQRVEKTAAWLDGYRPGWEKEIDKATLNLRTWSRCVLGQLDGCNSPSWATGALSRMEKETGMSFSTSGFGPTLDQSNAAERIWIEEIDKRLTQPSTSPRTLPS